MGHDKETIPFTLRVLRGDLRRSYLGWDAARSLAERGVVMPKTDIPFETLITDLHGADWGKRCDAARLIPLCWVYN